MAEDDESTSLVPRLRFPEFREKPAWPEKQLHELAAIIAGQSPDGASYNEVGNGTAFYQGKSDYGEIFLGPPTKWTTEVSRLADAGDIVMSVRAPVGALNVTNQKICIGRGLAAIQAKQDKWYLFYLLDSIKDTIVGNGGSVFDSINKDQIERIRVFASDSVLEQRRIADCLTSLDGLIAAHGRKLAALRAHKRGLMQHLFPREGEPVPRLRFAAFRDAGEWSVKPLGDLFETATGGTPDRAVKEYWGGSIPWVTTSLVDHNVITAAEEFITEAGVEKSSAKLFPKNSVLVALYGQGKTRGKVALLGVEATTNQACAAILPNDEINPLFTFANLSGRYDEMRRLSNSGGQENLSQGLVRALPFPHPSDPAEQQQIAACLGSLDDLIAAEAGAIDALKTQKKGLMQGLFPAARGD